MKIREVSIEDLNAVRALVKGPGWNPPTEVYWRRLWDENPAMRKYGERTDLPRGWVIEQDGVVLGYLANVIQEFCYRGKFLSTATASSFVVAQEARGLALNLAMAFASQRGVDLLLNTTAAAHVSEIFQFLKFSRMPQPGYGSIYYWVTNGSGYVAAGLRKIGVPRLPSKIFGCVAGPFFAGLDWFRGRRLSYRPDANFTYEILELSAIDDEIAELWRELCERGDKLTVARTPEILRWHLSIRDDAFATLVKARIDNKLVGYAAIVRSIKPKLSLVRCRIVDLIVQDDDPMVLRGLLRATFDYARRAGAHILDIQGLNQSIVEQLLSGNPRCDSNDGWPYLFKSNVPDLAEELSHSESWYPSALDGDTSLEPAPEPE